MFRGSRRLVTVLLATALAFVAPRRALGWATAEHVRFGQQIAGPFETSILNERLPVIAPAGGPQTFGHWVSAPDFGRGLRNFLTADPVLGPTACSVLWNPEGVVDGRPFDDQNTSVFDQIGQLDCVETLRMNNSHFGDFAAFHYAHYHALAVVAARRYRVNHQPACQEAAYTLEGWGRHYLTDMTAIGHGWNPAGTYESGFDWQTTNSITQRMRVHNALNDGGGRFAGAFYRLGVMWGDHSETHLPASVPELADDPQRQLTLHLTRMSLGQVVMAAECGGPVDAADVLAGGDATDPRQPYVSDESMCGVMYGEDIGYWAPDWFEDLGLDMADVQAVVDDCRDHDGNLVARRDGQLLARHWYQDRYYEASPIDGWVSSTLDPEAVIDPADLGCGDDLPVVPLAAAQRDACGMLMCATPPVAGACPDGTALAAGCCLATPTDLGVAYGQVTATPWQSAELAPIELAATGAVRGESPELLWFPPAVAPVAGGTPVRINQAETARLTSAATIASCGAQAGFSVHEAKVALPRAELLAETFIDLRLTGMDEGLRVEVDGRAVAYLNHRDLDLAGGTIVLPLFGQALPPAAGGHVVRLVHLNDCGAGRPLVVRLEARGPIDAGAEPGADAGPGGAGDLDGGVADDGAPVAGGCCRTSDDGSGGLLGALAPAGVVLVVRRRRRRR